MRIFHNLIIHILLWIGKNKPAPRLKKWIELESKKEKIIQAVESNGNFPSELFDYVSTAWGIDKKWYEYADWTNIIKAFYLCLSQSPQVKLPLTSPNDEKLKEESWDYPERNWYLYSHLIAKSYGWTLETISNLRVEDALATIQEIIVDNQLEREFQHGLSEIAYQYDRNTKTSKFVPLPRPHWMRQKIMPIKKFKVPASMLPVGNVIADGVLPPELMPKEIIH